MIVAGRSGGEGVRLVLESEEAMLLSELADQEQLDAMRPALDGNRIQEVLGIGPGREVGEAYRFLLEVRLDEGIVSEDDAERRLREWWAARD